jgi:hypothetical protein
MTYTGAVATISTWGRLDVDGQYTSARAAFQQWSVRSRHVRRVPHFLIAMPVEMSGPVVLEFVERALLAATKAP